MYSQLPSKVLVKSLEQLFLAQVQAAKRFAPQNEPLPDNFCALISDTETVLECVQDLDNFLGAKYEILQRDFYFVASVLWDHATNPGIVLYDSGPGVSEHK